MVKGKHVHSHCVFVRADRSPQTCDQPSVGNVNPQPTTTLNNDEGPPRLPSEVLEYTAQTRSPMIL